MNACFFDLDGTLIDSKADLAETVNHTRRDLGLAELPIDQIALKVGRGARNLLIDTIPERAEEVDRLWEVFMSHYGEHLFDHVTLYPGVRNTLEELVHRGWKLGINTAKPRFATVAILEHFGLKRFFGNAIVAGGDCEKLKPDPEPMRKCASLMGGHRLSSHDWMVGDNWTDVQCATNCGMKGAFCAYGFGRLNDSRYTVKITAIGDLLRYLKAED